jgi:hypothetical protein
MVRYKKNIHNKRNKSYQQIAASFWEQGEGDQQHTNVAASGNESKVAWKLFCRNGSSIEASGIGQSVLYRAWAEHEQ